MASVQLCEFFTCINPLRKSSIIYQYIWHEGFRLGSFIQLPCF